MRLKTKIAVTWRMCMMIIILSACGVASVESNDVIAGTYTVTVTQERVFELGGNQTLAAIIGAGSWQLELTEDGTSRLSFQNDIGLSLNEEGPYHLSGDKIIFETQTGEHACRVPGAQGIYNWKIDNGQLILTAIEDECDRKYLLIAEPWSRQP